MSDEVGKRKFKDHDASPELAAANPPGEAPALHAYVPRPRTSPETAAIAPRKLPPGQITVAQLRALLAPLPDDAGVWSDGCDCTGEACGVQFNETDNAVTIVRAV